MSADCLPDLAETRRPNDGWLRYCYLLVQYLLFTISRFQKGGSSMADKYVVVNKCFDACFNAQVGQYPDNDKDITKDYHLDGPPMHAILLCTKAALPSYRFVFTKPIDQAFVESCSNKSVANVKGMITASTDALPGLFEKAPMLTAAAAAIDGPASKPKKTSIKPAAKLKTRKRTTAKHSRKNARSK
jgi:hypothetical protein